MPAKTWTEAQALTRSPAAPTLITEGMSLVRVSGFRVILSAASGQTLSGAGSLDCYLWDDTNSAWIRNPDLDIDLAAAHSGVRRVVFPDQEVTVPYGRVLYAANGITVSGGTLTVEIRAN